MTQIKPQQPVRQREGARLLAPFHLKRLRELGCCVCGHRPVEIHHLITPCGTTKRAMGKRAGDDCTVALCGDCHRAAHRDGAAQSFERKYGLVQEADYQWSLSNQTLDDSEAEQ